MRTLVEKYTATQNVTVTKMNVLIRMFTLLRCMPKTGSSPPRRSINTQVNFWYLSPGPTPYIYSSSLQLSLLWSQHALLMWKLGYVLLLFKVILKKAYNFSMNKNQTSNSVFFFIFYTSWIAKLHSKQAQIDPQIFWANSVNFELTDSFDRLKDF